MAKLDRFTVRGFKSIRALDDFALRGLNVLIGPNGAGKSNFLNVFEMLQQLSTKRLQLFTRGEGGSDALLFGGRRRTSSLSVTLSFDGGRYKYQFSLEPVANKIAFGDEAVEPSDDPMEFGSEKLLPGVAEFIERLAPGTLPSVPSGIEWQGGHEEARLADIGRGEFASCVLPDMQRWRVFHFQDMSRVAQIRLSSAVRDDLHLKPDAGNLAPFIRRLRIDHPEHYRRIVETVRLAAPFFGDFIHRQHKDADEQIELEWCQADDPDSVLGPFQLSDGTLRFICLATLLLQPPDFQPGLILIDEPELGLHPAALTLLAEMLQHASDERQVIVSTQSADLVSELDPEDVVVVDRKNNASAFTRLEGDRLSGWLEDYALGELWKMNVLGGRPAT